MKISVSPGPRGLSYYELKMNLLGVRVKSQIITFKSSKSNTQQIHDDLELLQASLSRFVARS